MFAGLRPRAPLPPEPSAVHHRQGPARPRARGRTSPCCACAMIRPRHDRRQARPRRLRPRVRGRPGAPSREVQGAGQAAGARARRAAARRRLVRRGRAAGQLGGRRPRRRRRRHRHGHDRRPHGRADGQRPDGQGGLVGAQDGREDPPHPGGRAQPPRADGLPRRLRRRAHHRPGPDVPRPPPRRADLLQRGAAVRRGAADLRAVRPERGRRRLHPGLLRHRDHARRQRLDVPRLAADGGDGDRREGLARGDGRGEDAHERLRLRALPRQVRRGGHRPRQALPLLLPDQLRRGAAARAARRAARRREADPRADPGGREQAVGHARAARRGGRRGLVPRGPQALGEGADRRLRAARRARGGDRRQPAEVQGRRAVRRLRRQGRALHRDLRRVRDPAAVPRRRARLHDRHRGREAGHHPPRRQDDLGGQRGDRARSCR